MFSSPITGLSFITNVLIVIVGFSINLIRRRSLNHTIISHKHILKLESTPVGAWVTSLIAVLMPFFIFIASGALSGYGLYNLYKDESRISIVDVAISTTHYGVRGYKSFSETFGDLTSSPQIVFGNALVSSAYDSIKGVTTFDNITTELASFLNASTINDNKDLFVAPLVSNPPAQKLTMYAVSGFDQISLPFFQSFLLESRDKNASSTFFNGGLYGVNIPKPEGEVLGIFSESLPRFTEAKKQ